MQRDTKPYWATFDLPAKHCAQIRDEVAAIVSDQTDALYSQSFDRKNQLYVINALIGRNFVFPNSTGSGISKSLAFDLGECLIQGDQAHLTIVIRKPSKA
jgi:hypothetical protein